MDNTELIKSNCEIYPKLYCCFFSFQRMECKFCCMERKFHLMECMFHPMELKTFGAEINSLLRNL